MLPPLFIISMHMQIAFPRLRVAVAAVGIAIAAFATSVVPTATSTTVASAASSDYFLKIDGIDGESTSVTHPGTIDVESWSWGASNPITVGAGGMGVGKVSVSDLSFTHRIDKASPKLFEACATGKHLSKVTLYAQTRSHFNGNTPKDNYVLTLEDVLCTSIQHSGTQNDYPQDAVTLNFAKLKIDYAPPGPDAALISVGWDRTKSSSL